MYPNTQRNVFGNDEQPIAVWLKGAGYNLAKLRVANIFHLDMYVSEEYAEQLVRQNYRILDKFID